MRRKVRGTHRRHDARGGVGQDGQTRRDGCRPPDQVSGHACTTTGHCCLPNRLPYALHASRALLKRRQHLCTHAIGRPATASPRLSCPIRVVRLLGLLLPHASGCAPAQNNSFPTYPHPASGLRLRTTTAVQGREAVWRLQQYMNGRGCAGMHAVAPRAQRRQ